MKHISCPLKSFALELNEILLMKYKLKLRNLIN